MKQLFALIIALTSFSFTYAQNAAKIKPPQIITKLKLGNSFKIQKNEIKLIKVTNDSRCPLNTTCISAEQATVLIGLYENNIFTKKNN